MESGQNNRKCLRIWPFCLIYESCELVLRQSSLVNDLRNYYLEGWQGTSCPIPIAEFYFSGPCENPRGSADDRSRHCSNCCVRATKLNCSGCWQSTAFPASKSEPDRPPKPIDRVVKYLARIAFSGPHPTAEQKKVCYYALQCYVISLIMGREVMNETENWKLF